uniref:Uncharacterized protein n=1 Tax=Arundo donax TaxID=35708 RepID=A0A0A9DXA4_ARUDO
MQTCLQTTLNQICGNHIKQHCNIIP